jgi:hypothetical protein
VTLHTSSQNFSRARDLDDESERQLSSYYFTCVLLHLGLRRFPRIISRAESIPQKLSSRNDSNPGFASSIPTFLDGSVQNSSAWTTVIDNGVVSLHHDFISTKRVKGNTRLRDHISSHIPAVLRIPAMCKASLSIIDADFFGTSGQETLSSLCIDGVQGVDFHRL